MNSNDDGSDRRVNSKFLMQRFDVADRTIDRWLDHPTLNFPKPIRINSRRYWKLSEVLQWERARESTRQHEEVAAA